MQNKIILIYGPTFSGKTRLGLTFPTPMTLLDSELSADFLLIKHKNKDQIVKFEMSSWADMVHVLDTIYLSPSKENYEKKNGVQNTIMLDSLTPLSQWAFLAARKELNRDTDLWYHAMDLIEKFFARLRSIPANVVITARMKERYENGNPTGSMIADINKKAEFFADVIVRCFGKDKSGVYKYLIEKDREHGISEAYIDDLYWAKIRDLDQVLAR